MTNTSTVSTFGLPRPGRPRSCPPHPHTLLSPAEWPRVATERLQAPAVETRCHPAARERGDALSSPEAALEKLHQPWSHKALNSQTILSFHLAQQDTAVPKELPRSRVALRRLPGLLAASWNCSLSDVPSLEAFRGVGMCCAILASPGPCSPSIHPRALKLEPEASAAKDGLLGNVPVMSREEASLPSLR